MVRFIRSTWPLVQGWFELVSRWSMPCSRQVRSKGLATKAGGWSLSILWQISELDAVVGEQGVNAIRNCSDQRFEESRSSLHVSTLDQLHESELRSAVDSHEEVELAFRGTHFGQIDME